MKTRHVGGSFLTTNLQAVLTAADNDISVADLLGGKYRQATHYLKQRKAEPNRLEDENRASSNLDTERNIDFNLDSPTTCIENDRMAQPATDTVPSLYERLAALPDNLVGEIIDGRLYSQPRPAGPHAVASSSLGADLHGLYQRGRGGPGGWWILDEPELHFVRDTEVLGGCPRIAIVARARLIESDFSFIRGE